MNEQELSQIKQFLIEPLNITLQEIKRDIERLFIRLENVNKIERDFVVMQKECDNCKKERGIIELEIKKKYEDLEAKIKEDEKERKNNIKNNLQFIVLVSASIGAVIFILSQINKLFNVFSK